MQGAIAPASGLFFTEGAAAVARYEHLPIYKAALDVALHFERVVAGFSRYHKYTLGTELRALSREVVGLIVKANSSRDKAAPDRTAA